MSINNLLLQRDELLGKIRSIEETCEGIDNDNNAKKIAALNMDKADLLAKKNCITIELNRIEQQLNNINQEINNLSGAGIERILNAIKNKDGIFLRINLKCLWIEKRDYFGQI